MRHKKLGRQFSRDTSHRRAMFRALAANLVLHERIETTEAKAKELRGIADRTINWGVSVSELTAKAPAQLSMDERAKVVHAKRMARRVLKNTQALDILFSDVAPKLAGRPGGYTRVLKTRVRRGDAAPMAFIELAVPMVLQWPTEGAEAQVISMNWSTSISPAANIRRACQTTVPEPASLPP